MNSNVQSRGLSQKNAVFRALGIMVSFLILITLWHILSLLLEKTSVQSNHIKSEKLFSISHLDLNTYSQRSSTQIPRLA